MHQLGAEKENEKKRMRKTRKQGHKTDAFYPQFKASSEFLIHANPMRIPPKTKDNLFVLARVKFFLF